ncbi:PAS domain-containing protein [Dongia deserti]|uniref:PAS domain-containing protein n=1 Tax=Dongia deserti TaxID=2268030 RepID=UPI000E64E91B|nr:PAS domain-containing protein [Dongia deserti]
MDSQWRIARDTFFAFNPDRELSDVLARVRSPKVAQVLRYWNRLRQGRRFPERPDIDPAAIKAALTHVMITGIEYRPFRVLYRLVGTEIVHWARVDFTNRYADELIFDDEGRDWTDYYRAVIDARKPAYGLTDWVDGDRTPLWAECIICPLSEDGEVIDRCLAVEDYEPMSAAEIETLPPVGERRAQPLKKASE